MSTSPSLPVIAFSIAECPPARLDKALARDAPEGAGLSRSRLAKLIAEGRLRVNGTVIQDPRARVAAGDEVEVEPPPERPLQAEPQDIPLHIAHEDDALIVVDKPAGLVVHPAPGTPDGTLVNALLHHFGARLSGLGGAVRPGIVHRIDKDTSGLLVVAKSDAAHAALAEQFAAHTVRRAYRAVCAGVPDPADPRLRGLPGVSWQGGTLCIRTNLDRHRTDRQRQAVVQGRGRHAVTRARVLSPLTGAALLDCRLETGRTHQIRVHLAHAGHGLLGDPVYGGRRRIAGPGAEAAAAFPRQALHAAELGFLHPITGRQMAFESPLPPDMAGLIAALTP